MFVVIVIRFIFSYNNLNRTNYTHHYFLPSLDVLRINLNAVRKVFLMTFKKVDWVVLNFVDKKEIQRKKFSNNLFHYSSFGVEAWQATFTDASSYSFFILNEMSKSCFSKQLRKEILFLFYLFIQKMRRS